MKNLLKLHILVLASFLLCACGKSPEKQILGKWQEMNGSSNIVEFFEDGTYRLEIAKGKIGNLGSLAGTWKILQDGRLKIDVQVLGMTRSSTADIEFKDDHMILTEEDGDSTEHKRIN